MCNSRELSEYIFTPGKLFLLDWNFVEGKASTEPWKMIVFLSGKIQLRKYHSLQESPLIWHSVTFLSSPQRGFLWQNQQGMYLWENRKQPVFPSKLGILTCTNTSFCFYKERKKSFFLKADESLNFYQLGWGEALLSCSNKREIRLQYLLHLGTCNDNICWIFSFPFSASLSASNMNIWSRP